MKNKKALFGVIFGVIFIISSIVVYTAAPLTVHFIDVGQGDSILIQTPSQNILIDGGERTAGPIVTNYLRKQGVKKLDLVVSTHPHTDHIGGLIEVLKAFPVKEVIDPAVIHTTKTYEEYLTLIDQKNIKFTEGRAGLNRNLDEGIIMHFFHPTTPSTKNLNDVSIVAKVNYNQVSFLFTGDAETGAEEEMISRGANLRSTVLKVGHHGSRTSTSPAFLGVVSPAVAVIMLGADNKYGHPHPETLNQLAAAGVEVYRTDLHGTIIIATDGEKIRIQTEKKPGKNISKNQLVGSKNSDLCHLSTCRYAKTIKPENMVWFSSAAEAKAAGYKPCGTCKPQ